MSDITEAVQTALQDNGPAEAPQFILVIQDNPITGELDIAGARRPIEFDEKSPAHRVARYIEQNLDAIVALAGLGASGLATALADVIVPEQKQLLLPGSYGGSSS